MYMNVFGMLVQVNEQNDSEGLRLLNYTTKKWRKNE